MIKKMKVLIRNLAITSLPFFTVVLMGPAELYFANVSEFDFLFSEFIYPLLVIFVALSVLCALFLCVLPARIAGVCRAAIFGGAIAGYLQVMLLDKELDILGLDPTGYHPSVIKIIINSVIWISLILIPVGLSVRKKRIVETIAFYGSLFILLIQLVGFVSMPISAPPKAFDRSASGYMLSGDEQFTVSANSNIIIIVLDFFSNGYLDEMLAKYPDGIDCLHDFTYYSNADSTYMTTYPSLTHMLTGYEYDPTISVADWCAECWSNDTTQDFYNCLHDAGYKFNVYTMPADILDGGNGCEILAGKIDNVSNDYSEITADTVRIVKCLGKMSCYRFAPEIVKPLYYENFSEYTGLVQYGDCNLRHENSEFYQRLLDGGLEIDHSSDYVIFQHLVGVHEYTTKADGTYTPNTTVEEACRGCMTIVEEYLKQLKDAGVYDNSTIIITADHGWDHEGYLQMIEFVKRPGETHDSCVINPAPISHNDLLATVVESAGLDHSEFGRSIFDISPNESRERVLSFRAQDDNYPATKNRSGGKSDANVFYYFAYTGDRQDLNDAYLAGPSKIVPIFETYF